MNIMNFKYVRVQGKELAKNTMCAKGIFSICWQMIQQDVMTGEDADLFREKSFMKTGIRLRRNQTVLSKLTNCSRHGRRKNLQMLQDRIGVTNIK